MSVVLHFVVEFTVGDRAYLIAEREEVTVESLNIQTRGYDGTYNVYYGCVGETGTKYTAYTHDLRNLNDRSFMSKSW